MTRFLNSMLLIAICLLLSGYAVASAAPPGTNDPFYSSVPSGYMDDPRRNDWQLPDRVMDHLFIKPGDKIADIGAGTGFFTMHFALRTGKNGMVYASDIDENMVQAIEKRARKDKLSNVRAVLGKTDDPMIPASAVDLLFICDTYLFIENRVQYLVKIKESLKPGGRLAIISFNTSAEIPGAPPPQRMVSKEIVIKEVKAAGFLVEADYLFLPFQDFLVFRKR